MKLAHLFVLPSDNELFRNLSVFLCYSLAILSLIYDNFINSRNEIYLKINMKFLIYAVILMAMMASVHSWNKIEHKTGKELLHVLEGGYVQRNRVPRLSRNENP